MTTEHTPEQLMQMNEEILNEVGYTRSKSSDGVDQVMQMPKEEQLLYSLETKNELKEVLGKYMITDNFLAELRGEVIDIEDEDYNYEEPNVIWTGNDQDGNFIKIEGFLCNDHSITVMDSAYGCLYKKLDIYEKLYAIAQYIEHTKPYDFTDEEETMIDEKTDVPEQQALISSLILKNNNFTSNSSLDQINTYLSSLDHPETGLSFREENGEYYAYIEGQQTIPNGEFIYPIGMQEFDPEGTSNYRKEFEAFKAKMQSSNT